MVKDRKSLVYVLTDEEPKTDDVSDDFFELTSSEAKALYQEFLQKRKDLDDEPLTTSSMRNSQKERKLATFLANYKYCVIRVQFPDRTILQGVFEPDEKFSQVTEFVKAHLENPKTDFYLFTAPPKHIPDRNQTLVDLKYAPAAKIYFGVKGLARPDGKYIKEAILKKVKTKESAYKEAKLMRLERNEPEIKPEEQDNVSSKGYTVNPKESAPSTSTAFGGARPKTTNKVPKWFKPQ